MTDKNRFMLKYGSDKHVNKLATSEHDDDRVMVARHRPEFHDKLKHDSSNYVKAAVADYSRDKSVLDHFVKHDFDHAKIMHNVARHGRKDHLDKLTDHPDPYVRETVAERGSKEHHDKLVNDSASMVRKSVAEHGSKEHLDKLVHDENNDVKHAVAEHGDDDHHKILMHDPDWSIRRKVAFSTDNHSILKHLVNDEQDSVKNEAKRKLKQRLEDETLEKELKK